MSGIKGILIDFDGVLSSLVARLGWPFYHALKKVKPKISQEEILYSLNQIMQMYLKEVKRNVFYVPKMIYKISQLLRLNYFQLLRFIINLIVLMKKNNYNIIPEENADLVLEYITRNYKTALVTHAEREVINKAHNKFKYLSKIDFVVTQQDLKYSKPHPYGLILAMKALEVKPKEVIFVGDLPHDIQAGKRAGTYTCAVVNFAGAEKGKRMILQKFKPDFIINHIKELPSLLEKIKQTIN